MLCDMNLPRLRKAKGLTQPMLAEMVGVDTSTISRAESMHPSAKLETYRLCAEALGYTLADIFADDITPVERALVAAFRNTPADQRGIWAELAKLAKDRDPKPTE